jgi:hypothetical protein
MLDRLFHIFLVVLGANNPDRNIKLQVDGS